MVAITCYYDDGECAKIDITDLKTLKDLKNKIYTHKFKSNISNLDDIVLITFAEIIKDSELIIELSVGSRDPLPLSCLRF